MRARDRSALATFASRFVVIGAFALTTARAFGEPAPQTSASGQSTPPAGSAQPAPVKKKKAAPPPPTFIEENLDRIAAPGSDVLGWGLIGGGIAVGAALFTLLNLAPRRLELGKPAGQTVQRITQVAHRALDLFSKQKGSLSKDELADLMAFYERWLNLDTDRREYFRDQLKRDGIDMAKVGDAIRWALTARPA